MNNSPTRIENWKPIVGYENVYSVSDMGRVRRDLQCKGARAGKILAASKSKAGYPTINPKFRNVRATFNVHELVLTTFVGPRPKGCCCNHKDGNKANNWIENLEWVTHSENHKHSFRELARIRPSQNPKPRIFLKPIDVIAIRRIYDNGTATVRDMSRIFGVPEGSLRNICLRRRWQNLPQPPN